MPFETKPLREVTENDIRELIGSGLEEHSSLEYKADLYPRTDAGRREFLLDCCMFANTKGGIILVGIPERRDDNGQPTGAPDPHAEIGIAADNTDILLRAYDASLAAASEERIALESAAIPVANNRFVLAFRVADSVQKPHAIRFQGHVYFPARRERSRFDLSVLEIKDMTSRMSIGLDSAEKSLRHHFESIVRETDRPHFQFAIVPIFTRPFSVRLDREDIVQAVGAFSYRGANDYQHPEYTFDGVTRRDGFQSTSVTLSNQGHIVVSKEVPSHTVENEDEVQIIAIDLQLHSTLEQCRRVYAAAEIEGPFLAALNLSVRTRLHGAYPEAVAALFSERTGRLERGEHIFPTLELTSMEDFERRFRPLCDHVHQAFGRRRSSCFDVDGNWRGNPFLPRR